MKLDFLMDNAEQDQMWRFVAQAVAIRDNMVAQQNSSNILQGVKMTSLYTQTHRSVTYANDAVSLHSHDFYELLLCRSSCSPEYLVGSERYLLRKGDIILIRPGVSHRSLLRKDVSGPYNRDVLWVSQRMIDMLFQLDEERIREEAMYDGFYAVVTNLEGDVREVININRRRWEIEENFRIIKTEFEARPVFVRREDSIKAHFLTCYISLLVYRLLEKKLGEEFTRSEILKALREMNITLLSKDSGYIPSYKRTKLTDALHTAFGFRTDYEFISKADMRTIIKETKQKK